MCYIFSMKTLYSLIFVLWTLPAFAGFNVVPVDHPVCMVKPASGERVFTRGLVSSRDIRGIPFNVDAGSYTSLIQRELTNIVASYLKKEDRTFKTNHVLCVGVHDDVKNINAGAYDDHYILFGIHFIKLISDGTFPNLDRQQAFEAVLYHEFAHTIQNLRNERYNYALKTVAVRFKELQADCLAGAMMYSQNVLDPKSYFESSKLLIHLGDKTILQDHGTADQRVEAFTKGVMGVRDSLLPSHMHTIDYLFNVCSQKNIAEII